MVTTIHYYIVTTILPRNRTACKIFQFYRKYRVASYDHGRNASLSTYYVIILCCMWPKLTSQATVINHK